MSWLQAVPNKYNANEGLLVNGYGSLLKNNQSAVSLTNYFAQKECPIDLSSNEKESLIKYLPRG